MPFQQLFRPHCLNSCWPGTYPFLHYPKLCATCSIKQLIFFLLTTPPANSFLFKEKKRADYLNRTYIYKVKTKQNSTPNPALYFSAAQHRAVASASWALWLSEWSLECAPILPSNELWPQSQQEVCHWLQLGTRTGSIIRNLELNKATRKGTAGRWGVSAQSTMGHSSTCYQGYLIFLHVKFHFRLPITAKLWPPWVRIWGGNALNMCCRLIWGGGKAF